MTDERIDEALRALPVHDLPPARSQALGRRARRVFLRAHAEAAHPWLAALGALWGRALEPALTVGAVAIYLTWAIGAAAALLGAA